MTPFISPQQVEKEIPSRTDVLLCSPLWAEHLIWYQVEVVDGLSGVLPPQHVKTQLDAWHTVQIDDGTFEAKAGHVVKVVQSHCHLSLNNMKGVGSILSPFNEALQQGSTHKLLWKKTNDRLEACLSDIALDFGDMKIVPLHHFISASPTSIRGRWLPKKKDDIRFLMQAEFGKYDVLMQ